MFFKADEKNYIMIMAIEMITVRLKN